MRRNRVLVIVAVGILVGSFALTASAAEQRRPLDGAPAVRHRWELRKGRFEVGPSFNFTLNRSLRQAVLFGAKAQYHFLDWLALGLDIGGGVAFNSGLASEIEAQYPNQAEWAKLQRRMSDLKLAGDVRAIVTPISGKMGIFSTLFVAYDFYFFGGFGFALLGNNWDKAQDPDAAAVDVNATNSGFKPGLAWGLGMHIYFNKFIAMGVEVRDILYSDNESGGDLTRGLSEVELAQFDGNPIIDGDDTSFQNNFFLGLSLTFFLPWGADQSE